MSKRRREEESASLRSRCSAIDGWRREGDPSVVDQVFTCPSSPEERRPVSASVRPGTGFASLVRRRA
jgi:hypothetical protein